MLRTIIILLKIHYDLKIWLYSFLTGLVNYAEIEMQTVVYFIDPAKMAIRQYLTFLSDLHGLQNF